MKLIHFSRGGQIHFGSVELSGDEADRVISFGELGRELPLSISEMIAEWEQHPLLPMAGEAAEFLLDEIDILPPINDCKKIICIGRNYADHAAELGSTVGDLPVVFNKFPTCAVGSGQNIRLPKISSHVDYEAELVVVIGRAGRNISASDASKHIFACCCGNDVTARDWQKESPGGQWLLGKSFDTFAPVGPWMVTADEVDWNDLDIELRLNGRTMQQSNTSNLIFKVDFLIAHVSKFCTLAPGDMLFTGTPAGVGAGRDPQVFLRDGDFVEVEITGLGVLKNPVVTDHS